MTAIKLKTVPQFPSLVIGGEGIGIDRDNGVWTISIDYSEIEIVSPYAPGPNDYVLTWDPAANNYFLVPAGSLFAYDYSYAFNATEAHDTAAFAVTIT